MDVSLDRLRYLDDVMPANVHTIYSDPQNIRDEVPQAGSGHRRRPHPRRRRPRGLVTKADPERHEERRVIVDVAIDQGGCIETARRRRIRTRRTVVDGVVHYCVTELCPARRPHEHDRAVQRDAAVRLKIANKGYEKAAAEDPGLGEGINLVGGRVTNAARRRVAAYEASAAARDEGRGRKVGRAFRVVAPTDHSLECAHGIQ
jgi:alanine dehydrogenase